MTKAVAYVVGFIGILAVIVGLRTGRARRFLSGEVT